MDWRSVGAGLLSLALINPTFATPTIGQLTDRYGAKYATVAGFLLALPYFVFPSIVTNHNIQQILF